MHRFLKTHLPQSAFQNIKFLYTRLQYGSFPCWKPIHRIVYSLHRLLLHLWQTIIQKSYFTPVFLSQIEYPPKQLHLYSGMPQLLGSLTITLGERCRISGISTWSGREQTSEIRIGNNVDIGWQNILACGTRIQIDDNARLAGKVFLAGYPGHPENAQDRAKGNPDTPAQIGYIHIKKDAWIGTGAIILANVTIGEGCIIATGSVVTQSTPDFVLMAGNPARVIRALEAS